MTLSLALTSPSTPKHHESTPIPTPGPAGLCKSMSQQGRRVSINAVMFRPCLGREGWVSMRITSIYTSSGGGIEQTCWNEHDSRYEWGPRGSVASIAFREVQWQGKTRLEDMSIFAHFAFGLLATKCPVVAKASSRRFRDQIAAICCWQTQSRPNDSAPSIPLSLVKARLFRLTRPSVRYRG